MKRNKSGRAKSPRSIQALGAALFALSLLTASSLLGASAAPLMTSLSGHIPSAVSHSRLISRLDGSRTLTLALTLPLRNQAELEDLLRGLSDPNDPRYGQFLTPAEFAERFSPTPEEYDRVIAYARSQGLSIIGKYSNRTVLDVSATAHQAEQAFGLHLQVYHSNDDGRYFYAPDASPQIPSALAPILNGVIGLDNASQWRPHIQPRLESNIATPWESDALPLMIGSGPGGGLIPTDIKTAYNLSSVPQNGSGQTLALFELDGYNPADITAYESAFGLPNIPLQNVLVDGVSGAAGSGADEVTLDIELMAALAPGATQIVVYEGPNSTSGIVDTYNRIATDNLAKQISTSWGLPERSNSASVRNSENAAFQEMAAQGQSIYAASGDSGAYDNGSTLSVDDPASQPYMVGCGGTSLSTSGPGGAYLSETTWNNGGGGISSLWSIPSYQSGVISQSSLGSTKSRNVPDVSLNADPNTGYAVYLNGSWTILGGTSCAAPLWAAFTALINQKRTAGGGSPLGFANIPIYALAKGASYASDFHDIADGSTNQHFPAVTGYDDATGWGTFNGASLLSDLSLAAVTAVVPASPTALSATPGNGQVTLNWSTSSGALSYNIYRSTVSGNEGSTPVKSNISGTTYTDIGLTNGVTYCYKVAAVNSVGVSGFSNEASTTPFSPVSGIINGSFETPSVGAASYQYNPTGGTWTFLGDGGIQSNGSGWSVPNAPDGTQTAFLNGNPNRGTNYLGAVSQSVNFTSTGTYVVSFQAAQRYGQVQPLKLTVDGVQVGGLLTPSSSSFGMLTSGVFTITTTGVHTIALSATATTSDLTTMVDSVTLTPVTVATSSFANGSFETPSVGAASYQYNPVGASWTFLGDGGIQSNGSGWSVPNAPDGTQTAFLNGNPNRGTNFLGAISQSVNFTSTGTYVVSFQAARRLGQVQPLMLTVDGVQVGGLLTPTGSTFSTLTSGIFTITTTGVHTIALSATATTSDLTTMVDSVTLTPVTVATSSLANASFETPSVGAASYQYNPTGGTWTFLGDGGIQSNGSGWGVPNAPDGTQTAFLNGNPNRGTGNLGAISQSVNFSSTGNYTITFQAAQRLGQVQPLKLTVDGVQVGGLLTPTSNSFGQLTSAVFTISTTGVHTIALSATATTSDLTTMVDQVSLNAQ